MPDLSGRAGHSGYVEIGSDGMYRPVCGCGWQGEPFANLTFAQDEANDHDSTASIPELGPGYRSPWEPLRG